jgi:photosystem II stability/assembly factor-like uncharacterized protein
VVRQTWTPTLVDPYAVISAALESSVSAVATAIAADAVVHRSVDRGATWSTITAVRLGPPLNAVAQSGASVFVGAQGGLHRSRDLGRSWSTVLSGGCVVCLGIIPGAEGRTLLAGTQSDGLLRSEDDSAP